MQTRIQSHLLFLLCPCLVALAFISCQNANDRADSRGSTVTILSSDDEWQLRPFENESPKFLVFLPLITLNEKMGAGGPASRTAG